MNRNINRGFVEKLQRVRNEYEDAHGPNPDMDALVQTALNNLLAVANDAPTINWANDQLERETVSRRLRRAERLVPSGILDADDNFYDPAPRMPSANPGVSLSAFERHNWNPDISVHPYSHNFPEAEVAAEAVAVAEPMVVSRPLNRDAPAFVLPPHLNPNVNRRCNRCNQLGHLRRNCPNPPVPGRRGPGNGSRGGKTRRHHNNKGKKSLRRGKH